MDASSFSPGLPERLTHRSFTGDEPSETLNTCPLLISTTQTARGLLRIYARLKGELVKQRSGEDVMMEACEAARVMEHIAALPPFLGVHCPLLQAAALRLCLAKRWPL